MAGEHHLQPRVIAFGLACDVDPLEEYAMSRNVKAIAKPRETDYVLLATMSIFGLLPVVLGLSLAITLLMRFAH